MASLNLLDAGGTPHGPDSKGRFTFLREDMQASNPTFDIADQQGVEWKVALGEAARSEDNPFLDKRDLNDVIDFVLHNRPVFRGAFNVPNDQTRTRMEDVTKKIPRADAKWLGRRLSMLSDAQIRDCFRAAGYTPDVVGVYTQAVRKRIAALNAL